MSDKRLDTVRLALLQGKTWRYLRYVHAREALLACEDFDSILVVGAGNATAEIGLALEFPHVQFTLTDWQGATHQTERAKKWVAEWNLPNVTFRQLDLLNPPAGLHADLVYSVEVLEHIQDDERAAAHMRAMARRAVFCLVPFAEEDLNQDPDRRRRALEKHEHHVVGYNVERLVKLLPSPIQIRGTYWNDSGLKLREALQELTPQEIKDRRDEFMVAAQADIRHRIPGTAKEAQGIWWLSRA